MSRSIKSVEEKNSIVLKLSRSGHNTQDAVC
jgi:hypothetical protein